jgi:hypothetical protein
LQVKILFYEVAYICTWSGSAWECGCQDSACTQSYWRIQQFKRKKRELVKERKDKAPAEMLPGLVVCTRPLKLS